MKRFCSNIKNLYLLLFFVASLINLKALDSQFRIIKFDNSNGLITNLIKNITQDTTGYIWLATDGGLLKYDGNKFQTFNEQLPTIFLKDITRLNDGTLLIASDLSISKIEQIDDSINISTLLAGKTFNSNEFLYYPKSIYEDNNGRLWISDFRSINSFENNQLIKYNFSKEFWSDDYTVSYKIAEDNEGNILASSWSGFLFQFNNKTKTFDQIDFKFSGNTFIENLNWIDDHFYLSTSKGLFRFRFINNQIIDFQKVIDIADITAAVKWKNNKILIGSKNKGVFVFDYQTNTLEEIIGLRRNIVKNIFIDEHYGIWVASDQGLILIKENNFKKIDVDKSINEEISFVRRIEIADKNEIYFTSQFLLNKIKNNRSIKIDEINASYEIFDFVIADNNLIISTRNGDLITFNKSYQIIHEIKFENDRPNHLYVDSQKNLWFYLENKKKVFSLSKDYSISEYNFNDQSNAYIEVIKEFDGEIYIAGLAEDPLFLKLNRTNNEFQKVIEHDKISLQINIFDFYKRENTFFIATNFGLLKLENGILERVIIPNIQNQPVIKAVMIDNKNRIWCGTDFGLIIIDENEFIYFDERNGLPNSTISLQAIKIDNNKLWVGTPSGIAYFNLQENLEKLPSPKIVDINFKKGDRNFHHKNDILYSGVNLKVEYSTLYFPTTKTKYYTRILGIDSNWTSQGNNSVLNIQNISAGEYVLEIRAENPGNYKSGITKFVFEVLNPWYLSNQVIPLYILISLILFVVLALKYNQFKLEKVLERERLLNKMVEERTSDLNKEKEKTEILLIESEKSKNQLQAANELKSQLLSIAAHDLKNPLQVILGYEFYKEDMTLTAEEEEMLNSIFNAAKKMLGMISETLESAAADAAQLELNLVETDLAELLNSSVNDQKILAKRKDQKIITEIEYEIEKVKVDKFWFREAIDNLISNAIKYSPKKSEIKVRLESNYNDIKLSINDNGPGFTDDDKSKLFAKFQRLSAKPTAGESSTGLGLFIVKQIIDKHKFSIELDSKQNEGSSFQITIPQNI